MRIGLFGNCEENIIIQKSNSVCNNQLGCNK